MAGGFGRLSGARGAQVAKPPPPGSRPADKRLTGAYLHELAGGGGFSYVLHPGGGRFGGARTGGERRRRAGRGFRGAGAPGGAPRAASHPQIRRPVDVEDRAARQLGLRRGEVEARRRRSRRRRDAPERTLGAAPVATLARELARRHVGLGEPGRTAVTAIPLGPSARASDWPNAISPGLAGAVARLVWLAADAPREAMLTIRPPPPMCWTRTRSRWRRRSGSRRASAATTPATPNRTCR